jgi:dephospho-CoA kinase
MRAIALTGGIATGKSTVAAMLGRLGAKVIDADEAVRAVQAAGSGGLKRLVEAFGPQILTSDGELDRSRMAAIAFSDKDARRRLEAIIHPLVREWMMARQQEAQAEGALLTVHDIPLLFESRGRSEFDTVLVVYAPERLQLQRLVEIRGMDEVEARARIDAQMPIERKRQLADRVIENTGTLEELRTSVETAWAELLKA